MQQKGNKSSQGQTPNHNAPYASALGLPSSTTIASLLCGAAFGASMVGAGFQQPSAIISQLKFENWHMIQAFLAATASSSLSYNALQKFGHVNLQPRSSSSLGLFSNYDGNIIGGSLLGAGMALSGSCPGVLLAQAAAHVQSGFYALYGAVLGGVIWSGYLAEPARRSREKANVKPLAVTLDEQFGVSRVTATLLFQVVCLGMVAVTTVYTPRNSGTKVIGLVGGLLIGLAQLTSLLSRKSMMGITGAYQEMGNFFWSAVKGESHASASYSSITFFAGVAAGAWALLQAVPSLGPGPVPDIPPLLAVAGGALMTIGSRMAGGCTSGHGISGMSLLSVSSVITIGCAFVVGAVVAHLVY